MGNLFGLLGGTKETQILLLSWADKHPYLFTLIEVTSPTLYIVLIIAGFNMVNGVFRRERRWKRGH
jgi:hypothetical protein